MDGNHEYPCGSSNCIACATALVAALFSALPWQNSVGCKCAHCVLVRRAAKFLGRDA